MVMTHQFHYAINEDTHTVAIQGSENRLEIIIGETAHVVDVRYLNQDELIFDYQGQRIIAHVVQDGTKRYVNINGQSWILENLPNLKRQRKTTAQVDSGDLVATMPGVVLEVLGNEGETVVKGTPLVILEAMKMELYLKAPFDGTIKKIDCQVGQMVERGQLLVIVD